MSSADTTKKVSKAAIKHMLTQSFAAFCAFFEPEYETPTHIVQLLRVLKSLEKGDIKRCIITMPPRSGKSWTTSMLFPAYYLALHPNEHVMLATYGQSFAEKFGRYTRNIMRSESYRSFFPDSAVPRDASAVTHFYTNAGGSFRSTSIGGVTSGLSADLFLIDDPHKDRKAVLSERQRETVHDWFKSAAYVRLTPNSKMVILQTRWHEDDLAGRLLTTEPDKWQLVSFPAILDDGSSYWPEKRPLSYLKDIKDTIGSYEFAALYMQEPAPREGGYFKQQWFLRADAMPKRQDIVQTIRYWDRASTLPTGSNDPDYTVGVKMCKTRDGLYYVLDVVRIRDTALKVQRLIGVTAGNDGKGVVIGIEQDPGQAGVFEAQHIVRNLPGFTVKLIRPTGSKTARADPVASQVEAKNVYFVPAKWNTMFFDEVTSFPFGAHDDIVDAFTGAMGYLMHNSYSIGALGS